MGCGATKAKEAQATQAAQAAQPNQDQDPPATPGAPGAPAAQDVPQSAQASESAPSHSESSEHVPSPTLRQPRGPEATKSYRKASPKAHASPLATSVRRNSAPEMAMRSPTLPPSPSNLTYQEPSFPDLPGAVGSPSGQEMKASPSGASTKSEEKLMQNCSFASSNPSPLNAASSLSEKGLGGRTPSSKRAERPRPNGFAATVAGPLGSSQDGLTDEQMAQLDQIFSFIDKNQDGKLTRKELLIALRKSGAVRALLNIPGHELVEVQADYEGQGRLGSAEAWWCRLTEEDALYRADFIKHFAANPSQALKGILLLERPKFVATQDWQPVPKGAACPPGLEYKMDLATGETLARLCEKKR